MGKVNKPFRPHSVYNNSMWSWIFIIVVAFIALQLMRERKRLKRLNSIPDIQEQLELQYRVLLESTNSSRLRDFLDAERTFLTITHQNVVRLLERFRHEEATLRKILKDWAVYLETIHQLIFNAEMLDVAAAADIDADDRLENIHTLQVARQEIENRFSNDLGEQYIDPAGALPKKKTLREILQGAKRGTDL